MSEQPKIPIHGPEGFNDTPGAKAIKEEERVQVKKEDLRPPEKFEKGVALIIPIVNVRDIRDPKDGEIGALYPEQAAEFESRIESFMDKIYEDMPEAERQDVDIIVLAGETHCVVPRKAPGEKGIDNPHQRAVETGDSAIAGIKKSMQKNGIDPETALSTKHGRPIAITHLNDVKIMHPLGSEADQKYLDFLIEKYGTQNYPDLGGRMVWMVFEDDTEKEMREKLGAEGPTDIADRTSHIIDICSTIADLHQKDNPEKRVIVFAFGHYDNLSPWIKKDLMGVDPAKGFVPMDKGGGIVVKRMPDKTASTNIGTRTFSVKLESVV